MLRIGLIGAGGVAARHAGVLAGMSGVCVSAVVDSVAARAITLATAHGARAYRHHDDMLAAEELDAVYVCVPPFAHGDVERAVLAAGVALFVEKPLACDLSTAEEIGALVEQSDAVTATGYHWRCLDIVDEARALLDEHPPRLIQASWLDKVPPPSWWSRRALSGGQSVEQTTHVLDLLRLLAGEVTDVSALGARWLRTAHPDADVDDVTAATLRFDSGAVGAVVSSCLPAAKHRAGVEIVCDGLVLELTESELAVTDAGGRRVRSPRVDPRLEVDRDFIAAVRGDRGRVRAPYSEALRTHRLGCALARSADEGRPIALA